MKYRPAKTRNSEISDLYMRQRKTCDYSSSRTGFGFKTQVFEEQQQDANVQFNLCSKTGLLSVHFYTN